MTEDHSPVLLVVYKPSGAARQCSAAECTTITQAWTALLDWLKGADPDELPHSDLIGEVARKAALRMVRFPAYDIRLWARQAASLPPLGDPTAASSPEAPLPRLGYQLLSSVGLNRRGAVTGRLNEAAIKLLYSGVPSFERSRKLLTARLLEAPVLAEWWDGPRQELALASKLLIRRCLSAHPLTNLIHMELTRPADVHELETIMDAP